MTQLDPISDDALEEKLNELLANFYSKRTQSLQNLHLKKVLQKKNPYLYRAVSTGVAADIVEDLLRASVSSSDETIFGNEFFEPLAIWVATQARRNDPDASVRPSSGAGADMEIETGYRFSYYAVKSGPSIFNAQSKKKQLDEFRNAQGRMRKLLKQFDPVIGFSYGRKALSPRAVGGHREVAGQAFWFELSGDPEFYTRIIRLMERGALSQAAEYAAEYDRAVNRFTLELLSNFADDNGQVDWEKLARFNSSEERPRPRDWRMPD